MFLYKKQYFPHLKTFICGLWLEEIPHPLFLFDLWPLQKAAWTSFIWTNLKAYCYSLWNSRWKMPHFFLLVMVIKSLSIDPESLNLTQKYLIINMFPFLSFVSSTLEKTQKRFLNGTKLSCQSLGSNIYNQKSTPRVQTSEAAHFSMYWL